MVGYPLHTLHFNPTPVFQAATQTLLPPARAPHTTTLLLQSTTKHNCTPTRKHPPKPACHNHLFHSPLYPRGLALCTASSSGLRLRCSCFAGAAHLAPGRLNSTSLICPLACDRVRLGPRPQFVEVARSPSVNGNTLDLQSTLLLRNRTLQSVMFSPGFDTLRSPDRALRLTLK